MKLLIDNFDMAGPRNYSEFVQDGPRVLRELFKPDLLQTTLVADSPRMELPKCGSRLRLVRADGTTVFAGNVAAMIPHYPGADERGPVRAFQVLAVSDEILLNRVTLPARPDYIGLRSGTLLRAWRTK